MNKTIIKILTTTLLWLAAAFIAESTIATHALAESFDDIVFNGITAETEEIRYSIINPSLYVYFSHENDTTQTIFQFKRQSNDWNRQQSFDDSPATRLYIFPFPGSLKDTKISAARMHGKFSEIFSLLNSRFARIDCKYALLSESVTDATRSFYETLPIMGPADLSNWTSKTRKNQYWGNTLSVTMSKTIEKNYEIKFENGFVTMTRLAELEAFYKELYDKHRNVKVIDRPKLERYMNYYGTDTVFIVVPGDATGSWPVCVEFSAASNELPQRLCTYNTSNPFPIEILSRGHVAPLELEFFNANNQADIEQLISETERYRRREHIVTHLYQKPEKAIGVRYFDLTGDELLGTAFKKISGMLPADGRYTLLSSNSHLLRPEEKIRIENDVPANIQITGKTVNLLEYSIIKWGLGMAIAISTSAASAWIAGYIAYGDGRRYLIHSTAIAFSWVTVLLAVYLHKHFKGVNDFESFNDKLGSLIMFAIISGTICFMNELNLYVYVLSQTHGMAIFMAAIAAFLSLFVPNFIFPYLLCLTTINYLTLRLMLYLNPYYIF